MRGIDGFKIDAICEYGFSGGLKVNLSPIFSCGNRSKIKGIINIGISLFIILMMRIIQYRIFFLIITFINIKVMSRNIRTISTICSPIRIIFTKSSKLSIPSCRRYSIKRYFLQILIILFCCISLLPWLNHQ